MEKFLWNFSVGFLGPFLPPPQQIRFLAKPEVDNIAKYLYLER
jgi:hypothetical protein